MANLYAPSITHIIPLTTIRRERHLPVPGTVTVRVGQRVQALDVIAEAPSSRRHLFLDLARGLGVPETQIARYLVHRPGDRVEAGEVIAGPVGISRRTVRAPADGRIVSLAGSRMLLQLHGEPHSLRAGFPGTVTATDGVQSVTLETTGALVQAVWGNGLQDYGIMRIVGDSPDDRLQTDKLDIDLRGAVLVAGICDQPAPLHQAVDLAVRGIVLGGLTSELLPLVRRLPFPVILTEGFGLLPINSMAWSLLRSNAGREAALDGRPGGPYEMQRPEIILPLPAARELSLPDEVVPLRRGVRVRVVRRPYASVVGVVQSVEEQPTEFPSGIVARSVVVDLEGVGSVAVPLANLEVLQ